MLKNLDALIGKYLSDNISAEDKILLEKWISSSRENEQEFFRIKKIWDSSQYLKVEDEADVEASWNEFVALTGKASPTKKRSVFQYMRVAAGVLLLVFLSAITYLFLSDTSEERPKIVSMQSSNNIQTIAPVITVDTVPTPDTLIIPKQKTRKVNPKFIAEKNVVMITLSTTDSAKAFLLPDNSVVFLNQNSTLSYSDNFSKNSRKVSLTGEAYFEVKKDTMQFIVACRNTITRGYSAAFNIKGYEKDAEVEVIIVSGNAEFSGVGKKEYKKLVLNEGDRGTYNKKGNISKAKNARKDFKWWQKKNLRAKIRRMIEKIKNRFH